MTPLFAKRIVIAALAVPFAMLAIFSLASDAQEKNKQEEAKAPPPTASGLYREFSGVIQLGNYGTRPQKKDPRRFTLDIDGQAGIESMEEYFKANDAPHIMGGTVYFAVFRNVGGGLGDTFGTGMPGGLDYHFVPGDGDPRPGVGRAAYMSPRLDTSAKYLFLFQVVASRGLDARNQMTDVQVDKITNAVKLILGQEANNKIKFAVGEEKIKLVAQQKDVIKNLADAVNKAMLPDDAIEDVHRVSIQLNVDPRLITSWGYFENAGFAVNIAGQKEYVDRWGHRHKTVADGGVIPNDLIEDRTQAVSFLPGVTEKIPDADFEAIKRAAFSMGVMEGSFHVDDANVGIEKSLPYRFAQGMLDRGAEIKFASHLSAGKKKADFAVKPERVRMVVYDDRQDFLLPEFMDDDYTTSALIVDFDQKGIQKRDSAKEVRGIPRTKHSMVFGFTTNLEPTLNRRLRVDDLESTDRNKDLPFSEFFSDKIAKKVPARDGYSRGHDYWAKGKKMAGLGINRDLAFVNRPFVASDAANPFGFVLQPGGGAGGGAAGGGAGALSLSGLGVAPAAPAGGGSIASGPPSFGGQQGGGGGTGGGFGMPGGWGGFPMRGIGGFGGGAGGFAGGTGGGTGGGSGNGSGNATPNQQQSSNGSQQGQQIINFKATLTNQQLQQQQQFQIQEQNQHQSQENRNRNEHGHGHHNHGHHGHGHVVPAPASLLLGLLGLPGLLLLRRRKNLEATA